MRMFPDESAIMKLSPPVCVAPVANDCGEAALWLAEEGAVYWTDVSGFLVQRLTVATGAVRFWMFEEPCVALMPTDRSGVLLLALGSRLVEWQPETGEMRDQGFGLEGWPDVRLNDGRAGPGGELWIGSMANNVGADGLHGACEGFAGQLFRVASGHGRGPETQVFKSDLGISNTVCFSPDERFFYFGDTKRNTIWRYAYDPVRREISNETVFFEGFGRGVPDGSAIDEQGYVWNCRFGGGCIVRIAPDGSVDRVVEMPISSPTTCAFGGADLKSLYVTSAAIFVPGHERLAGGLFRLDSPVAGLPPHVYRLG